MSPVGRALLRRHLDHQPARLGTWFTPLAHWIVGVTVLVAVVAFAVAHARAIHEARAARQEACEARLEAWTLRNPALARPLPPRQDACTALARVEGTVVTPR